MKSLHAEFRLMAVLAIAAAAAAIALVPASAQRPAPVAACTAPSGIVQFVRPLNRVTRRINAHEPITIVAIGSSSTAGAGASSSAANYPSRLAAELKTRFPLRSVTMINHGVNGTEMGDMLSKFDADVVREKPDLVLWQLGTNSVLRDRTLDAAAELISGGLARLKTLGVDVILINPQYAPRVLAKAETNHMLEIISTAASQGNVNLFDRFAVMRHWRTVENMPFSAFLSPDELHMNDWSYGCVAKLMAKAIGEAVGRPAQTATAAPARN